MYKKFKQFIYRLLIPFIKLYKYLTWLIYLNTHEEINLVVGAGLTKFKGWFVTDISTLDITKESDFNKYFTKRKINKVLAEHVFEHLTIEEIKKTVSNFHKYSNESVNIRIAVPDGFHADKNYIESVKPGGAGEGADDHKNLFTYKSLSEIFAKYGFKSDLIEYWDDNHNFHTKYFNDNNGFVERCMINDSRNKNGKPNYTSLIIDFTKE